MNKCKKCAEKDKRIAELEQTIDKAMDKLVETEEALGIKGDKSFVSLKTAEKMCADRDSRIAELEKKVKVHELSNQIIDKHLDVFKALADK